MSLPGPAIALLAAMAAVMTGVACHRRGRGDQADVAMAALVLAPLLAKFGFILALGAPLAKSLPLHVCDVAGVLCFLALLTRSPQWATGAILTSLLLSSVAVVLPDMGPGPTRAELVLFWFRHAMLVAAAAYLLAVLKLLPTWRGFRLWAMILVSYAALALLLNPVLGTNYGYLSASAADGQLILALLGPWPQRAPLMIVLPLLAGALVTTAVGVLRRAETSPSGEGEADA
jgi:hypothetical integral membrane protein (TIGR02206 family)